MFIVFYHAASGQDTRHSAWKNEEGAKKQIETLEGKNWSGVNYSYHEGYNLKDGHYFV